MLLSSMVMYGVSRACILGQDQRVGAAEVLNTPLFVRGGGVRHALLHV
jgi:hypothetical protein